MSDDTTKTKKSAVEFNLDDATDMLRVAMESLSDLIWSVNDQGSESPSSTKEGFLYDAHREYFDTLNAIRCAQRSIESAREAIGVKDA